MNPYDIQELMPSELPPVSSTQGPPREILPPYGLVAEFESAQALVAAAEKAREAGYKSMEAYSPFPIEGLTEALGQNPTKLPMVVFLGGAIGGVGGFLMQWYTATISYPLNVAGRPLNTWPMFIPVTFECIILGAALAAVLGMLLMNGLPMPYHPLFNLERFALASRDRFFLSIRAIDPQFDLARTRDFLASLDGAREVTEVPQ